jgi:hypothetical protein
MRSVPLPDGVDLSAADRELAEAILQAIAGLRSEGARPWQEVARRLEAGGWEVGWRLGWIADARRRGVHEQAVGRNRDDAFAQLWDLTLLDDVEGCP